MFYRLTALLCLLTIGSFTIADAKTPRPLADVPIQTPENRPIFLKQYKNKVVILVIFGTTCDDCIRTLNLMNQLQKDYAARGLQVVAAAGDDNAKYTIGAFVQRYRPLFPVGYLDKEAIIKIAELAKTARPIAPIILFIDRLGTVRFQYYGNDPFLKDMDKNFRAVTTGLLNSNERHLVTRPAPPPQ